MVAFETTIVHETPDFSHEHAERHSQTAASRRNARWVVLDLALAQNATTSAFARLVLLRRLLLRDGRDLRLINLHSQAAGLYEVNRLDTVLPRT